MPSKIRVPTNDPREIEQWRINLAADIANALTADDILGVENQIVVTINANKTVTIGISEDYLNETENQVIVTRNIDNSVTLSLPQDIATNSSPAFAGLLLNILDAASTGLTLTGASNQTGRLIQAYDSSGTDLYHLWHTGHISNIAGMNSEAAQYGTGIILHNYEESTPEHTNGIGSYDHTGGSREMLFTKTFGDDFTQDDADNGNFIILFGANVGATAEIKEYIDADNVVVDGSGWDADLTSQSFGIYKHPVFFVGDGNDAEFSTGATGKFEIFSYNYTGDEVFIVELDAAADNIIAQIIEIEANGYNTIIGHQINYNSGDLQPGDVGANQLMLINDTEASSADSTTQIAGSVYITTNASDAVKDAMVVLPGFDRALEVQGAEAADPDYGYETTSGTSVDRVNSGGGGNDAFVNNAVNVELFDNNGDDILIGSDSTFEIIEVILAVSSSKDLEFNFWYSKAGGNWTALTIQADNTVGFTSSGAIVFNAPGDWTKDDEDLDGNAITNAYYVALTRTYAPVVGPNLPTESFFKTFASQDLGMYIRGDGAVKFPYLGSAPSNLVNGLTWTESDGIHTYVNDTEYIVDMTPA